MPQERCTVRTSLANALLVTQLAACLVVLGPTLAVVLIKRAVWTVLKLVLKVVP